MTITADSLIYSLERNYDTLSKQVDGISDAESLLQLPFRGNCMNWVLGHILQSRSNMLRLLGGEPLWTPEQITRYGRNARPVLDASDALPFAKMVADLHTSQSLLLPRLKSITQAELDTETPFFPTLPPRSIGGWLMMMLWHETYHTGNTESLRQLAGKDDQVM